MQNIQTIAPCLWFDDRAEEAAALYTTIFSSSKIVNISRYGEAGYEVHGKPAGTVMAVAFELNGQAFAALNGGKAFKFNEAISFQVHCQNQEEVDYYWEKLSEGGMKRHSNAAGLRTNTAFHGKLSPAFCSRCSMMPILKNPKKP